ncbi:glycine-rich domain-containing protein [Amycolatopsis magusensis]|uniref:glycine-rich domain-containing protein n=1 Tax=Amycolatopsis magusensis TaxID=882444 RepID=UPI00379D70AF
MTSTLEASATGAAVLRDPQTYLTADVWDKEIALLMRDHPFDKVMAERLLGQAVAYLITSMELRGQRRELGPGELVDIAVHTLILDTRNYFAFCERYNGGYLHHVPEVGRKSDGTVQRTAEVIAERGFMVDWPLWEADFTKCSPCHPGSDSH